MALSGTSYGEWSRVREVLKGDSDFEAFGDESERKEMWIPYCAELAEEVKEKSSGDKDRDKDKGGGKKDKDKSKGKAKRKGKADGAASKKRKRDDKKRKGGKRRRRSDSYSDDYSDDYSDSGDRRKRLKASKRR